MSGGLLLALPSKGRLKDHVDDWLADCGLPLRFQGGPRGYSGSIEGMPNIEARLIAAQEVAEALAQGEVHLGVTGEDLLAENIGEGAPATLPMLGLGFGRADLVVAAPASWIDVTTMADLDEVAHLFLARTGRRLRVATKYAALTRAFFARHGVVDYRIVDSTGATEGAPAAGAAELVVDLSTTGATLAANGLKRLADGLVLASQAQVAASLRAAWDEPALATAAALVSVLEARARAREAAAISWPPDANRQAKVALERAGPRGGRRHGSGLVVGASDLFDVARTLAAAGVGPLTVTRPAYVFDSASASMEQLRKRLAGPRH